MRSILPLANGRITKMKIKLLEGFVFIFGVTTKNANIASEYIGRSQGSYGFGCEDGHIYDFTNSPLVDTKCTQGD